MQHSKQKIKLIDYTNNINRSGKGSLRFFKHFIEYIQTEEKKLDIVLCKKNEIKHSNKDICVNIIAEDKVFPVLKSKNKELNSFSTAIILANKKKTNRLFLNKSIPLPNICNWSNCNECLSFSEVGSQEDVYLLKKGDFLDKNRYNVDLIDTSHEFKGSFYHTSIRILAVCGEIIDCWLRFRPANEPPIVHSKNTPLNSELLNYYYPRLIEDNYNRLKKLTAKLYDALGPGFYAHDVLVDQNNKFFICESGFKFDDQTYRKHLQCIDKSLIFGKYICNQKNLAGKSASLFLNALTELEWV